MYTTITTPAKAETSSTKYIHFFSLLLLLLVSPCTSIEVKTDLGDSGPRVCVWSDNVLPKNVASMCTHRGRRYIAGQFNRFFDQPAKSFAVLEGDDNTLVSTPLLGANSRLENARQKQNGNFASAVSVIVCNDESDLIYLGGSFRNVTNPYTVSELSELKERAKRDSLYVIPDPPELVVNNFVAYNTTSGLFVQVSSSSSYPPGWFWYTGLQMNDPNAIALVRTVECTRWDNGCDEMYIGGTFEVAFGMSVSGLVKVSNLNRRSGDALVVERTYEVSSGVVTTVSKISDDMIVIGGIFGPKSSGGGSEDEKNSDESLAVPLKILHNDLGEKCPISVPMQNLPQCRVKRPSSLCCEKFFGAVFSTLKLSAREVLVGGDFTNPMEFETVDFDIPDGIPDNFTIPDDDIFPDFPDFPEDDVLPNNTLPVNITPPDLNVRRRRRRLEDLPDDPSPEIPTATFGTGYSNILMVAIPQYDDEGRVIDQSVSTRWYGGPNAPVIDMECRVWDDDLDRCTEVLVAGEFTQWIEYLMDDNFKMEYKTILALPERMCVITWDENLQQYTPGNLVDRSNMTDSQLRLLYEISDPDNKVTTIHEHNGTVYAGGTLAPTKNLLSIHRGGGRTNSILSSIPEEPLPVAEPFVDCMSSAYPSDTSFEGASFCCRRGSYCPREGVDMPCPIGWGYRCTPGGVNVCPEGYYCPTPGEQIICPVGHVCLLGSIEPIECTFFELCGEEGLARPAKNSGFVFAAMLLGGISICVFFGSRWEIYSTRRNKKFLEARFHERFNAFKAHITGQKDPEDTEVELSSRSLASRGDGGSGSFSDSDSSRERRSSFAPMNEAKIDLTFKGLTVTLANGLKILNGIDGKMKSGTMTAIMGPSGCGKSTLMNALTYRIRDGGKVGGEIFINGEKKHLLTIKHVCGFVPQEDVMHRDLSVRENLRFYLRLKGNPSLKKAERRAFVNEIVDILGLEHVQHSLIGDELRRGISGGQRKRVNIAIELMGSPLVLFLDEPTSGLDATTSQQLVDSLEKLSELGLTVAMVIHQPRIELLNKIHDLILLQRGGWPVYVGPTQNALPYFEEYLGLKLPNQTSSADFFLDVITLDQKKGELRGITENLPHGKTLIENWANYVKTVLKNEDTTDVYVGRVIPPVRMPSTGAQAWVYFVRSLRQLSNNKKTLFVDACLGVFAGSLAGFVAKNVMVGNQMVMTVNGLIGIMNALRIFGPEKAIFRREMQSGISSLAYFIGRVSSNLPVMFMTPLFFMSTYYRLAFPEIQFFDMYCIILSCLVAATGIGFFLSLLVEPKNAQTAGIVFGLVAIMTCGLNPTLRDLQSTDFGYYMTKVTYGSATMSALFVKGCTSTFKAGFKSNLGFTYRRGYHELDGAGIDTELDIYEARIELETVVWQNMLYSFKQCAVYMVMSYLVIFVSAKQEIGGVFVSITQSKQANRLKECCGMFWLGRKLRMQARRERREKREQKRREKEEKAKGGDDSADIKKGENYDSEDEDLGFDDDTSVFSNDYSMTSV